MSRRRTSRRGDPRRGGGREKAGGAPAQQSGDGYRRSRLSHDRADRRRRLVKFILVGGIVAAVAIFLSVSLLIRARGDGQAEPATPLAGDEGSGNVMVLVQDEAGGLSQLAVLTSAPEGYSFYTIPARTVAASPEHGFQQLDVLYETAGQPAVDQAVADLLQIPIQYHVVLTYPVLEQMVGQAGSINFATATPLAMNPGADGAAAETVLPAGENPNGTTLAMTLARQAAGDNLDGPRVLAAFYQGLRNALAAKPEVDRRALARQILEQIETDLEADRLIDLFAGATDPARKMGVWPLPVKVAGEGGAWYFEPVADEIDMLLTGSPADADFILEIQNGTEAQGVVEAVNARLASLRFATTLKPEPSGVNFDNTQIRCGVDAIEAGNRVQASLGAGTLIKDEFLEKNQIIVIIGRDIATAMPGQAATNGT